MKLIKLFIAMALLLLSGSTYYTTAGNRKNLGWHSKTWHSKTV